MPITRPQPWRLAVMGVGNPSANLACAAPHLQPALSAAAHREQLGRLLSKTGTLVHNDFTRRTLYERVWAEPTRTVAQSLGVSDVSLAKTGRAADVPTPPRG